MTPNQLLTCACVPSGKPTLPCPPNLSCAEYARKDLDLRRDDLVRTLRMARLGSYLAPKTLLPCIYDCTVQLELIDIELTHIKHHIKTGDFNNDSAT